MHRSHLLVVFADELIRFTIVETVLPTEGESLLTCLGDLTRLDVHIMCTRLHKLEQQG
jgi:hypothetical protein